MALDADGDNALTIPTNVLGVEVAAGTANSFGPYLQKMPTNAFNGLNTVLTGVADPNSAVGDGSQGGWYFNTTSGEFNAIDSTDHAGL
jgi:hypothetical protein